MKDLFKTLKWIVTQTKSHIPAVVAVILLSSALSLCSVGLAVVSKNLIDAATLSKSHHIGKIIVVFVLLIFFMISIQAFSSSLSIRTLETLSNHMRRKLFRHLAQTEWQSLSGFHSGDILTRMTSDVGTVAGGIVNVLPGVISLGVRLVSAFGTLMIFDKSLAILAFILGPVSIFISRFFAGKLKTLYKKIQEAEGIYRSFMQECLQNILVVKSFRLEDAYVHHISELQNERLRWVMRRNRLSVINNSILSLGYWAGYFLAFCWGAMRLSAGTATFGVLTAFFQLVNQVQSPFIGLAYSFPQLVSTVASAERLMVLDALQKEDVSVPPLHWPSAGVTFDHVSFAYEQEKPVLINAAFDIYPGEIAAVVGQSGEGKTTIVRLLLSLIKPDEGEVRFFNHEFEEHKAGTSSRSLISYVPQGNTLFSGTIAENLRAGCPDASDKDLEDALRAACAWEFVDKLPEKTATITGEKGMGLSEGQAQRLSIARALLHNTPILILDEATSALDSQTETSVLQSIRSLRPSRTCIIITHRSAALKICDKVIKIKEGCIVEHYNLPSPDSTDLAM